MQTGIKLSQIIIRNVYFIRTVCVYINIHVQCYCIYTCVYNIMLYTMLLYLSLSFKQPTVCRNPNCVNRRRFLLDINQSRFVDFQKVRIQETQQELPRGSIPRSLEIILRAEAVEMVQAGDKCDFIGTLIAIPDVAQLAMESEWKCGCVVVLCQNKMILDLSFYRCQS